MEYLIRSLLISILVPLGMGILLLFLIFKYVYSYWDKFDIPVIPPRIPYGSLGNPFTKTESITHKVVASYKILKESNKKHGGIYFYLFPYYLPVDLPIIKNILIKDFNYFIDRSTYSNKEKDPLSASLLTAEGQEWKNMRKKLTPLFTIHKLKQMIPLFQTRTERLVNQMNDSISRMEPVKIKDLMERFATDNVVSSVFGVECNSLENQNCRFRKIMSKAFHLTPYRFIQSNLTRTFPNLARALGMVTFSRQFSDFILKLVDETFVYRIKNKSKHVDIFQSLMDVEKGEIDDNIKKTNIAAQALLFFNAGSESAAITITFAVYELVCNPLIQNKLRNEVISILEKHNGKITYEAIMEMEYLGQVIDETLRKYPPTATISRKCVQDYHVEGSNLILKKGVTVLVSILAIHKDPEYYPDPEVFDPERFNETNKAKRLACTYLPFLDGPRNCIGTKFGLLQIRLGLVTLLKNFKFSINPKTGILAFDPKTFMHRFSTDLYLDLEKI